MGSVQGHVKEVRTDWTVKTLKEDTMEVEEFLKEAVVIKEI